MQPTTNKRNLSIGLALAALLVTGLSIYLWSASQPAKVTSGQTSINEDAISKVLPHQTDYYKMSYTVPDSTDKNAPITITITMAFFEPGDEALPATPAEEQDYLDKIRKYRKESLDYLAAYKIDINQYTMVYTEPNLRDEFPKGRTN